MQQELKLRPTECIVNLIVRSTAQQTSSALGVPAIETHVSWAVFGHSLKTPPPPAFENVLPHFTHTYTPRRRMSRYVSTVLASISRAAVVHIAPHGNAFYAVLVVLFVHGGIWTFTEPTTS